MFNLYKAEVVKPASTDDHRITIRVIPHMVDITDENTLPKFPAFLKTEIPNFPTKSIVWIIADELFKVGYVLGQANIFSDTKGIYTDMKQKMNIMNNISASAGGGIHAFEDLYFLYVDDNIIEAININRGAKITYHSNGSLFIQTRNGIFIKYGTSTIEVRPENISIRSKQITLSALEDIIISSEKGNKEGSSGGHILVSANPGQFVLPNGSVVTANAGVKT